MPKGQPSAFLFVFSIIYLQSFLLFVGLATTRYRAMLAFRGVGSREKNSCKPVRILFPFTIFVVKLVFYNEMPVFSLGNIRFVLVAESGCTVVR